MRLLSGLLVGLVLGCAGDLERSVDPSAVVEDSGVPRAKTRAEEDARAALADRGISFTGASFVEWAGTGDLSVVELFVEGGMPIDAAFGGWTALHEAARNGHLAVVEYLIDQGASVGPSVRDVALRGGHGDVVRYLARAPGAARAALADRGIAYTDSVFIDSAWAGNLEVVKLFVAAGMAVNAAKDVGSTALHWAAGRGHLAVVEFLVGAGASVDARNNNWGWTALHLAASGGSLSVVEFLVGAGADVTATTNDGETPRAVAARNRKTAVVEYFDSLDDDG